MAELINHNGGPPLDDRAGNWFAVSRDIFVHPIVGIGSRPYTDLEAWLSLLAMASYEPRRAMNKGTVVVLDPGDLMAAHGYLAQRWQWTIAKVRWFLQRLSNEAMITRHCTKQDGRHNNNQIQIISICNYARYQLIQEAEQQAKQQASRQANSKPTASQQQEDNTLTIEQVDSPLPPKGGDRKKFTVRAIARQAFDEWCELARRINLPVPRATSFNDARARDIYNRMAEHAGEHATADELLAIWRQGLRNVERSSFLRFKRDGQTDLTFMCQRKSFTRLIEGGYGNGAHAMTSDGSPEVDSENSRQLAMVREQLEQARIEDGLD